MMKALFGLWIAIATMASVCTVHAAPVTFWFAGIVDGVSNPSNALPANIQNGTPFYCRVSYETTNLSLTLSNQAGTAINYYFRETTGFSFLMQIGGHTVTNSTDNKISQWSGNVCIHNDFIGEDQYFLQIGNNGLVTDGAVNTNTYVNFELLDSSSTAFSSNALPNQPPNIALFPDRRRFNWYAANASNNFIFQVDGEITQVSTNELVALNVRQLSSNSVQVAWPRAVSGGVLQSVTNVNSTNWQAVGAAVVPVGMENTATVSTSGESQFYRLKLH